MEHILIDWKNMEEYSEIPIEYRFIDKCDVVPGKEAIGTKVVSSQEWYFKIHFPGNPIMPGIFLMEAMQQTGLLIITSLPEIEEKLMLFQGCKNMRMYKSVRPGDVIKAYVKLNSYSHGVANYDGKVCIQSEGGEVLACTMNFTLAIPQLIPQIKHDSIAELPFEKVADETVRGGVNIDWKNMGLYLADTEDFRFVDKALVAPGKFAIGNKLTSSQDWYFNVCPKTNVFMPSGALIEAMMQTGVLTVTTCPNVNDNLMLFNGCKSVEFYDAVHPGELLEMKAILLSYRLGIARIIAMISKIDVDPTVIGSLESVLILPKEMIEVSND